MTVEPKNNNLQTEERRIPGRGRRVSDKYNQVILDNIPVSIITIDKDGNITSTNKFFKNFSGKNNHSEHNVFKDEFFIRENLVDDYKKLLTNGTIIKKDHCYERTSDGKEEYLNILAVPIKNTEGNIIGAVSMASDNTEAVVYKNELLKLNEDLEEKVKQRTEALDNVNKELSKVLELKSIFMADISHEFRTSLTIMQCSLELISKSGDIKKENLDLYNNIVTEIKRVATMLTDLSLLTKSDSLDSRSHHKEVDLDIIASSICKEMSIIADEKEIKIEYKKSSSPVSIVADKDEIEKLLMNLIRNAIKYNKKGGWIKVSTELKNERALLKVQDSGIGIPEKELPNIFERFYRVDKSRTRKEGGSGLGLAICKHIVENHGGKITVESKVGEGSIFTVILPHNLTK